MRLNRVVEPTKEKNMSKNTEKEQIDLYVYPSEQAEFVDKGWPVVGDNAAIQVNYNGVAYCLSFGEKVELYIVEEHGGNMHNELVVLEIDGKKVNVVKINNELKGE